ncbi:uncharacterized protein LOC118435451 [Folsomia candida]|nr:uncharacterized protein LOC118435451 [Folsomia candida]
MPDATFTVVNPTLGRSIVPQDSESSSSSPQNMENQVYLPGWKTQYLSQPIQPNATLKHDSDLFFGLGSCPYKSADESDLEDNNGERFLRYYMTLLRSWCLPKEVKMMKRLIKDGALVVSGTILKVNEAYLRRGKLSPTQLEDVSIAFEMHLFSQMVNDARSSSVVSRAPAGKRVSRSVRFLEDLIIKGVQEARSLTRRHFIHLTRQLILVAKVTYTKLLQDFDVIEPCDRCVFDKRLNLNDRMEVMALIQWLLKGMGPLNKAGADSVSAEDSFTNFFNINNAAIEARVQNYAD